LRSALVSARKQRAIISREYRPVPDDCARALLLLLKKTVIEEVGRPAPEPADRDGTEVQGGSADAFIIPN
jgi:hypothetical protein